MSNATHETAPTEFVQVGGVRFAYRRFGRPGDLPLLLLNYFAATLDDWDSLVTNGLACEREVILFVNAGLGNSTGDTPPSASARRPDPRAYRSGPEVSGLPERGDDAARFRYAESGLCSCRAVTGRDVVTAAACLRTHESPVLDPRHDLDEKGLKPACRLLPGPNSAPRRLHSGRSR